MISFKEYLNEVKFKGKYQAFEKPLYESFLDFLQDYYNTDIEITLSLKKKLKDENFFGHVDLVEIKNKKYIIVLEHIPYGILSKIAHEFVHIKQIIRGELDHSKDYKSLIWKKKKVIALDYYNSIKSFEEYKTIPWEREAYKLQEVLVKRYKKSNFFKLLDEETIEPNLRFMIDNDLVL